MDGYRAIATFYTVLRPQRSSSAHISECATGTTMSNQPNYTSRRRGLPGCWGPKTVNPELQRFASKRMGATTVEVKSSHVPKPPPRARCDPQSRKCRVLVEGRIRNFQSGELP